MYASLRVLAVERVHIKQRVYGYVLKDTDTLPFPDVERTPGRLSGKSWLHSARNAVAAVNSVPVTDKIEPKDYAEGFTAIGNRFLELAAHADALKDHPDWRIKMGFAKDTEKE